MKKVLVLEDEANIRSFVVINLKRAGYEAIEAETGASATTIARVSKCLSYGAGGYEQALKILDARP